MEKKIFYRAEGARTGDVIPKYIDGKYELFYLKGWKNPNHPEAVHGWHRMESENLVHMGGETPIHVEGGTGDLIYKDNKYHLFACIFPEGKQYITHYVAKGNHLDEWEYVEEDTFGPDGEIYSGPDWRDPRVFFREDLGEYWMLVAARVKGSHSQTGCVGLCVSKDLKHWEYRAPFYYPARFAGACECPDIFRINDWYYLVFSSYTNLFGTYYVKCRVGSERWEIPENHRLDARAFYAAKTAGDGSRRFLFGWIPTKEENIFGFWPDKLKAQDYRTWDWGGDMVIHELCQQPNGDLGLCIMKEKRELLSQTVPLSPEWITKGWERTEKGFKSSDAASQQMMLLQKQPSSCYISMQILTDENTKQAGIVLHTEKEMQNGYYFYLEPDRKRLVYRSWLRMSEEGGKTFPYDVEMEVPVKVSNNNTYRLEVLTEERNGVIYINGEAAMSFKMYDLAEGCVGMFAFGTAAFENIKIQKE